jgi:coiled-coil domain-containing protein 77
MLANYSQFFLTGPQALSDAHTYLFDERERLLALQAENDQLRLQEAEDRQRIKQLLALTRPAEQHILYQQENTVQANTVFPRQQRSKSPARSQEGGERILRTVYLPAAQTESLSLKCEALQAQLQEQVRIGAG